MVSKSKDLYVSQRPLIEVKVGLENVAKFGEVDLLHVHQDLDERLVLGMSLRLLSGVECILERPKFVS